METITFSPAQVHVFNLMSHIKSALGLEQLRDLWVSSDLPFDATIQAVDDYNDEVLREHLDPAYPVMWAETSHWDDVYSHDRLWS